MEHLFPLPSAGNRSSAFWKNGRRWLAPSLALLFLASCETGTLDPNRFAGSEAIGDLVLNAAELDLLPGETFQLETTILGKDGTVLGRSGQTSSGAVGYYKLSYSSSDASIASVDDGGLVEAVDSGTAVISVSSGPIKTSARTKVNNGRGQGGNGGGPKTPTDTTTAPIDTTTAPEPSRINVSPGSANISAIGASVRLAATVYASDSTVVDDANITWASRNPEIATVDTAGTVIAKLSGTAFIVAASAGLADTVAVEVDPVVSSVTISPTAPSLQVGDSITLVATAKDANGNSISDASFSWTSADSAIVSVSSAGLVRALKAGSSSVTATASGTTSKASAPVTVESAPEPAPAPAPSGPLAAFPGAEGWGANALESCRSLPLEVLRVTSLAGSGTGTLRQALLDARSDRFSVIVFQTGGTIPASYMEVPNSCVYVAGQTAPGDGIQINGGGGAGLHLPRTGPADIVLRYLRIRSGKGTPGGADGIAFDGGSRIVFDHVSLQWGNDENVGMQTVVQNSGTYPRAPIQDVTFQRVNNSAALRTHSAGLLIGGDPTSGQPVIERISLHHNLFAHNAHRNPRIAENDNIDFANNVVYNWHSRVGATTYTANVDYRNNYLKAGPWSNPSLLYFHDGRGAGEGYEPSVYLSGNVAYPFQSDPSADQKNLYRFQRPDGSFTSAPSRFFRSSPQAAATIPVTLQSASAAYASVLADVGANALLSCDGSWRSALDRVDALIIHHAETGTGPKEESETDHHDDYGGFPVLASGTPCADSDKDGLPDAWELRYGGSSTGMNPATVTSSGYLTIEHYLNGTRP